MIAFFAKLEQEQGSRIREKIRIDVNRFGRSNRCWRLANEFTHFTAQMTGDAITVTQLIYWFQLQISYKYARVWCTTFLGHSVCYEFFSIFFIHRTVSFNSRHRHLHFSVRSLRLFACHGNAGTENIYNGCLTNAAAEASYDRARSLYIQLYSPNGNNIKTTNNLTKHNKTQIDRPIMFQMQHV